MYRCTNVRTLHMCTLNLARTLNYDQCVACLQILMNASQVGTTVAKPAPTQLALLSVGVERATPYRVTV